MMMEIGLIVGGGSGLELAQVFREGLKTFCGEEGTHYRIDECPYRSLSFTERKSLSLETVRDGIEGDFAAFSEYYRAFCSGKPSPVIYRTGVNAETLYRLRREFLAVKVVEFSFPNRRVLFVRDELQGYYANEETTITDDKIEFRGSFDKERLGSAVSLGKTYAGSYLRGPFTTWIVYKHHLFANVFETWSEAIGGIDAVLQPGAAYEELLDYLDNGDRDLLFVASNEIGDILHEVFLTLHEGSSRETSIAANFYLHPDLNGLVEYQTVHGSADAVAGTEQINPVATLRGAAQIAERHLDCPATIARVEDRVARAVESGLMTQNLTLNAGTSEVVSWILGGTR